MSGALRSLGVVGDRWEHAEHRSVWSAPALVLVAWGLMALNRFGGLTLASPRAFARLTLVGVWGWLALSVAIWAAASAVEVATDRPSSARWQVSSMRMTLATVGWAHTPIIGLALVILIAAGVMQLLGPGLVVAVLVFAGFFPLALITGVRHVFDVTLPGAVIAVTGPYIAWFLVVARYVLRQVEHLL